MQVANSLGPGFAFVLPVGPYLATMSDGSLLPDHQKVRITRTACNPQD
jgi:hypothetical protein